MLARTFLGALGVMVIGGCAMPAEPRFGSDHPASPQASEAPVAPASQTLAPGNPAAPVTGAMPTDQTKPGDMGGMKHDGHKMP